jgi:hypothetical protein
MYIDHFALGLLIGGTVLLTALIVYMVMSKSQQVSIKDEVNIKEKNNISYIYVSPFGPYTSLSDLKEQAEPKEESEPKPVISDHIMIQDRDHRVLEDPLYPPLNRDSVNNTKNYINEPRLHMAPNSNDAYRLIGYLVNIENKDEVWKLFAREQYNRRGLASFYAANANKNIDIKIALTNDVIQGGQGLRDLYDLPTEISIKHPMFMASPYKVVSLPNSDWSSQYY